VPVKTDSQNRLPYAIIDLEGKTEEEKQKIRRGLVKTAVGLLNMLE
jgi:hypothetical protein